MRDYIARCAAAARSKEKSRREAFPALLYKNRFNKYSSSEFTKRCQLSTFSSTVCINQHQARFVIQRKVYSVFTVIVFLWPITIRDALMLIFHFKMMLLKQGLRMYEYSTRKPDV